MPSLGPPKGGIEKLYAYYRLSDHEMTNISLRDKTLKEETAFEGFMDWTFKQCNFNATPSFGVEGARIPEDTRGTPTNPEPFPPYGSNGLNFDSCLFTRYFEIKQNCVAVFKDCTILDSTPSVIEDACRVEFINCTFHHPLEIRDFCEVRFRNCNFASGTFGLKVENHSTVLITGGSQGTHDTFFIQANNDCEVTVDKISQVVVQQQCVIATEGSLVKFSNCATMQSATSIAVEVDSTAKFEARSVQLIQGLISAVAATEGDIFLQDVESVLALTSGPTIDLTDSQCRCRRIDNITHQAAQPAISAVNSKVSVNEFTTIMSVAGDAIYGDRASFDIDTGEEIVSQATIGVNLTGQGKSVIRNISAKIEGMTTGVKALDGAKVIVDTTPLVEGLTENGVEFNEATVELLNVDLVRGLLNGIYSSGGDSRLRVHNIADKVLGTSLRGMDITGAVYDLKDIVMFEGPLGGTWTTDCKGVAVGIDVIQSASDAACSFTGLIGPSDWDDIGLIYSESASGLQYIAETYQTRMSRVGTIGSLSGDAISVEITDAACLRLHKVTEITSESGAGVVGTVSGQLIGTQIGSITTTTKAVIELGGGDNNSVVRFDQVGSMTAESVDGDMVSITGQGRAELEDVSIISGQTVSGSVVNLSGVGTGYGVIKVLDCGSISAQECDTILAINNALLADIVGVKSACVLTSANAKTSALQVAGTNLYVSNYSQIATQGNGNAITLSSGPRDTMYINGVATISGKNGIMYTGSGDFKLTDLPAVSAKTDSDIALAVNGYARVMFHDCNFMGNVEFTKSSGEAHNTYFTGSITQVEARIEIYSGSVGKSGSIWDLDNNSSAYMFNAPVVTSSHLKNDGAFTADVSEFLGTTNITGAIVLNKCTTGPVEFWVHQNGAILANALTSTGRMWIASDGSTDLNTAGIFNGIVATGGIEGEDYTSVIVNGYKATDAADITMGLHSALVFNGASAFGCDMILRSWSGSLINGATISGYQLEHYAGSILNGVRDYGDFLAGGENGIILNGFLGGWFSDVTIGQRNGVIAGHVDAYNFIMDDNVNGQPVGGYNGVIGHLYVNRLTLKEYGNAILAGSLLLAPLAMDDRSNLISCGGALGGSDNFGGKALVLSDFNNNRPGVGIGINGQGGASDVWIRGRGIYGKSTASISFNSDSYIHITAAANIVSQAASIQETASGVISNVGSSIVHVPPIP